VPGFGKAPTRTCNKTHPPFLWNVVSQDMAIGSWPWPRETAAYRPFSEVNPSLDPNPSTAAATSTPGERKMKIGVPGLESARKKRVGQF